MPPPHRHSWNVSPSEAERIQGSLAELVEREDRLPEIRFVAGVDLAYTLDEREVCFAGVVVIDLQSGLTVTTANSSGPSTFPYSPGLLSFREIPHLLDAFQRLDVQPDLIVCDGQGIAHPRRCGLACHLGVLLDIPTIGCAKTRFIGEYREPGRNRGDYSPLYDNAEAIGAVLRTQEDVKPLFVSIGHRISLDSAIRWVLELAPAYRQSEPIRRANQMVNEQRATYLRTSDG